MNKTKKPLDKELSKALRKLNKAEKKFNEARENFEGVKQTLYNKIRAIEGVEEVKI